MGASFMKGRNCMKRFFTCFLVFLFFSFSSLEVMAGEELPPVIDSTDDLTLWLDYACVNGIYGHTNSKNSVVDMDCSGFIRFIYSKMGYEGSAWDLMEKGEKITKLSEATTGDIVVWVNPNTGRTSHFAILLNSETGELVQFTGKKAGCVSETLSNQKSWSNLVDMRVNWSGEYKNWNWGENDESAHPDNIYIIDLVDLQ